MPETNVDDFIDELNAGVFKQKLATLLSDVALGTINHGDKTRKGKVIIELSFMKMGDNDQVIVSHKLSHQTLTRNGKRSEENTTDTPMFVGKGGVLSISPPKEENNGQFNLESQNITNFKGNN